jgi:hypothetical protein
MAISPGLIQLGLKGLVGQVSGGIGNVKQAVKEARSDDGKINFKEGLKIYGEGFKGALGGSLKALTGMDLGLLSDPEKKAQEELLAQQEAAADALSANQASMKKFQSDIDIAGQTLSSPLSKKNLTSVGLSYTPLKMKAKQMEQSALMMKVSGSSTLPENKKY